MARELVKNPGKTAKFYRSNPKSRLKHRKDELARGKSPAKRQYRSLLIKERRKRGIDGKGGKDVSHKRGKLTLESAKQNRARGGKLKK